jgi:Flp pilus assembly protein TadG
MIIMAVLYGAGAVALAFRRRPPGVFAMMFTIAFLGTVLTNLVTHHYN